MAWTPRGQWCCYVCTLSVLATLLWDVNGIRTGLVVNRTSESVLAEDNYEKRNHAASAGELALGPPKKKTKAKVGARCEPVLDNEADLSACREICSTVASLAPQPIFPLHFFGGLKIQKRSKVKTPQDMLEKIGACQRQGDIDCLQVKELSMDEDKQWIRLGHIDGSELGHFAYPLHAHAYFSCYTRTKLPLFKAWLVHPALQESEEREKREGNFKNPSREDPLYEMYHSKVKDEFLTSGDVSGVWSEYFGLDQGHWAPDAAFRQDKAIVKTTYYYINVSPQTACLNRGNWEGLEKQVREKSVSLQEPLQVYAGPLRQLPDTFVRTKTQRDMWRHLLDFWRVASEVLMETFSETKDPHWVEATWLNDDDSVGHCILRAKKANPVRDERFPDFVKLPTCSIPKLTTRAMLHKISLFLMTEAGAYKARRGVRVPMGYWKVVNLPNNKYCCWLMDQTDEVAPVSGEACLATIKASSWGTQADEIKLFHPSVTSAGDEYCNAMFTPNPKRSVNCEFKEIGIGWRGAYILREGQ
mmetsp:Transcript_139202/g.361752  ORF Transcript_139202/g.361752 Transcript_139202/m.361752 type:complete len:529 (-) Transcript_139202:62-1648(-)